MPETRVGTWSQTWSGGVFWPLDPRPEEVDLFDIAHSLAYQCRYGGHVTKFYSVAEHSILCSYKASPENALWALMHDATEAYLVDVPRPIKGHLKEYATIEANLARVIAERFKLPLEMPDEVHEVDERMLATERTQVMNPCIKDWGLTVKPYENLWIEGLEPAVAERRFYLRFMEINLQRLRREEVR